MAEGWLRHWAGALGLNLDVHSAGTQKTALRPEAVRVMREVGIDLAGQYSKTLFELPDPWNFDLVLTVCDAAREACPAYPAKTARRHVAFPDPVGKPLAAWRRVRDALGGAARVLAEGLARGRVPGEEELRAAAGMEKPPGFPGGLGGAGGT